MKIAQIISSISKESSGPSYSVPGLCRGLSECGCDVSLHCLDDVPARLRSAEYEIVNYPRHDFANLGNSRLMKYAMRDLHADIVHNNGMWMFPNVYCAEAKRNGAKLVMAPRGCLAEAALKRGHLKKSVFGHLWQYPVLKAADMFHATSEKEYEEIRAHGYKQPVAIVPIGMDIPCGNEVKVRGEGEGEEKEIGEGEQRLRRVVFFGRLHKVKAVDRLVQAWELLTKEQGVDLHSSTSTSNFNSITNRELVIAGPDGGIRGELEQYIAEHKIPRVRFVGEINGPAKYEFLSSADLYVLPSFTENFGVTVTEALACGTPVIASTGTPWKGVEDNHCGWWVENTPEVLAETLRKAMSLSDDERAAMGVAGRAWIRRDFTWVGVSAKMKAAYEWLLNPACVEKPSCVII